MVHEDARDRGTDCLPEDLVFRFVNRQVPSSALGAIEPTADRSECRGLIAAPHAEDGVDEHTRWSRTPLHRRGRSRALAPAR